MAEQNDADGAAGGGSLLDTPLGRQVQDTLAQNALALSLGPSSMSAGHGAQAGSGWRDIAGKIWNAPNELVGKAYGYLGDAVGGVGHAFAPDRFAKPEIRRGPGQTEFINNPFASGGAVTIGSNILYEDDPYSPQGRKNWAGTEHDEGHPVWEHEQQHIHQARQLGPFYLPSNLAGGIAGLLFDRDKDGRPDWHGEHNWNERGPQSNPPRPWASKIIR